MIKIEELLRYEQPGKYIVSSTEYSDDYETAVLTPGQSFILGYTNESENIFDASKEPIILFDDFTTSVKYVDIPFKVKSSACKILHATGKCDIKYAYYLLKSLKIDTRTHKRYWISNVSQMETKELTIEEQKKIANELSTIENAIEECEKQIEDMDKFLNSKFDELFGNPIINNKQWKTSKIGDVTTIVSGTTPDTNNQEYWDGGIKWITPAEINEKTFLIDNSVRTITQLGIEKAGLKPLPKGTVIFSSRAPIGKTAIAGTEMYCNQGFKNFICSEEINNCYLFFLLKKYKDYFDSLGTGATFRELSKSAISKIEISIPEMPLQKQFEDILIKSEEYKEEIRNNIEDLKRILNNQIIKSFK